LVELHDTLVTLHHFSRRGAHLKLHEEIETFHEEVVNLPESAVRLPGRW